ncbi:MAG: NAD-dependent epimerase/dehydratase family protein, partial [Candidatus Caldarchaeum sp.]
MGELRVLITGARGFIGRHLTEYLSSRGFEVVGADVSDGPGLRLDVTENDAVLKMFEDIHPEACVHLAAVADIAESLRNPYRCFSVNCVGTLNILEAARRLGLSRVVVFSSANYYGAPEKVPVVETDPPAPRTVYDFSKVALEQAVWSYHRNHGVPAVVLRPWKAFGEYEPVVKMVPRFITSCLENKPIPLYNGGADITDPYHVDNLCHAVQLCLTNEKAVGEAFNVGTGGAVSVRQLAEKIKQMTGSSSELQTLPPRTPAESKPMKSIPSIEKISHAIGYAPRVSLEEGLRRVINYYQKKS